MIVMFWDKTILMARLRTNRPAFRRRLHVECLERRTLLSADVFSAPKFLAEQASEASAQRVGELLQLIVSLRDYQFA